MIVMMQDRNSFASYKGQWQKNIELVCACRCEVCFFCCCCPGLQVCEAQKLNSSKLFPDSLMRFRLLQVTE